MTDKSYIVFKETAEMAAQRNTLRQIRAVQDSLLTGSPLPLLEFLAFVSNQSRRRFVVPRFNPEDIAGKSGKVIVDEF